MAGGTNAARLCRWRIATHPSPPHPSPRVCAALRRGDGGDDLGGASADRDAEVDMRAFAGLEIRADHLPGALVQLQQAVGEQRLARSGFGQPPVLRLLQIVVLRLDPVGLGVPRVKAGALEPDAAVEVDQRLPAAGRMHPPRRPRGTRRRACSRRPAAARRCAP